MALSSAKLHTANDLSLHHKQFDYTTNPPKMKWVSAIVEPFDKELKDADVRGL